MDATHEEQFHYDCPKCGAGSCETGEVRAAGGFLSAMFDVQSRRFTTVSCTECGFTELYKAESRGASKILDFLTG